MIEWLAGLHPAVTHAATFAGGAALVFLVRRARRRAASEVTVEDFTVDGDKAD